MRNLPNATLAVRPYERMMLANELRLDLDSKYSAGNGGYQLHHIGQVYLGGEPPALVNGAQQHHNGQPLCAGPDGCAASMLRTHVGTELRLTLTGISFTRHVDRYFEILGLAGGFFGVCVTAITVIAEALELLRASHKQPKTQRREMMDKMELPGEPGNGGDASAPGLNHAHL